MYHSVAVGHHAECHNANSLNLMFWNIFPQWDLWFLNSFSNVICDTILYFEHAQGEIVARVQVHNIIMIACADYVIVSRK